MIIIKRVEIIRKNKLTLTRKNRLWAFWFHANVVVKSHYFLKDWKSREVNNESFMVELGIAHYTDEGKQLGWEVLAAYEPINIGLYYEQHIFRKNILQIR